MHWSRLFLSAASYTYRSNYDNIREYGFDFPACLDDIGVSDPVLQKNLNGIICKPPFLIHGMEACLYEKKVFKIDFSYVRIVFVIIWP